MFIEEIGFFFILPFVKVTLDINSVCWAADSSFRFNAVSEFKMCAVVI